MVSLNRHEERRVEIPAPLERVFEWLDDPARLTGHMSKSSWRMGGGRMKVETDDGWGQRLGSRIRVTGRAFGLKIGLEEVVIVRDPPCRKVWETVGSPQLLVIGPYRLGFELTDQAGSSGLRVFIDYALPEQWPASWLGRWFGPSYARWCVNQMVRDAYSGLSQVIHST